MVEDNAFNQQVAFELLSAEGADVALAGGGIEGVTANGFTGGQLTSTAPVQVASPTVRKRMVISLTLSFSSSSSGMKIGRAHV